MLFVADVSVDPENQESIQRGGRTDD